MRTESSSFASTSPGLDAGSFAASNERQESAHSNAASSWTATENHDVERVNQGENIPSSYVKEPPGFSSLIQLPDSDASGRFKRVAIQQEPMRHISETWEDFQERHFEWKHRRPPASRAEIPPNEGKLPTPTGWRAVLDWVVGTVFGGPGLPGEGIGSLGYRSVVREITLRPEEMTRVFSDPNGSKPIAQVEAPPSAGLELQPITQDQPHTSYLATKVKDFEVKDLDTQGLIATPEHVYSQPGKNQEYVEIAGKWYASAEEKGQRYAHTPNEDGVSSIWPLRYIKGKWRFVPLHELASRPIISAERIPKGYRVDAPTNLQVADAQGIYRAGEQEYVKIDGLLYRSGQNETGRFIHDGNPSHRIAVQRSDQGWTITPPSRGLGGAPITPSEIIQDVFNLTPEQAREYLGQYRFEAHGVYTERNFARELNDTLKVPGWAERFRVAVQPSTIPAGASQPAPAGGREVVNPISGQRIHIDEGGYLNSAGFIERTDTPQLYRVIGSKHAGKNNPTVDGFHKSYRFDAVPKMIRGEAVITSADTEGPVAIFGHRSVWGDHYAAYRIDAKGLKSVSLRENLQNNPDMMERVLNIPRGTLSEVNAIPDQVERARQLDNLTESAYSANEVHVENEQLDPARITFEYGVVKNYQSSDTSSPESVKTWSPNTPSPSSPESSVSSQGAGSASSSQGSPPPTQYITTKSLPRLG